MQHTQDPGKISAFPDGNVSMYCCKTGNLALQLSGEKSKQSQYQIRCSILLARIS